VWIFAPTSSVLNLLNPVVLDVEGYTGVLGGCRIRLDRNENPYGASPNVIKVLVRNLDKINRYPDIERIEELSKKIAEYCKTDYSNIVVTCGSDCAIELVAKAFLRPGDAALTVTPTFTMYKRACRLASARVIESPLRPSNFSIDEEDFLAKTRAAKILFLSNPNNPTGNLLVSQSLLESILERDSLVVVIDEAYYEYSGMTFASLVESYHNLVVLRTFSKAFGLAGLRIGYAIASSEVAEVLRRIKLPYDLTLLSIEAAIAALEDLQHVRTTVLATARERDRLSKGLFQLGFRVFPSTANFLMFSTRERRVNSKELCRQLALRGIAIRDLSSAGLDPWYARVTVGRESENELLLDALQEILEGEDRDY